LAPVNTDVTYRQRPVGPLLSLPFTKVSRRRRPLLLAPP